MEKKPAPSRLTIGRLAEATGVHVETIRYYEKIRMLASPARSAGGHRHYAREHVASLNFIRRGRELGFPLETIRDLLRLNAGGACCEQARSVTVAHRADVRRKLADLEALGSRADRAHRRVSSPTRWPQCPIMEALALAQ